MRSLGEYLLEHEVTVVNTFGLHAKPAVLLVKTASRFLSDIFLRKDDVEINAKSILGVLILAAEKGIRIVIRANGPDEEQAMEAMTKLFEQGFGEE